MLKFKFLVLNLELILRIYFRSLIICIKVLFTNYFSFANISITPYAFGLLLFGHVRLDQSTDPSTGLYIHCPSYHRSVTSSHGIYHRSIATDRELGAPRHDQVHIQWRRRGASCFRRPPRPAAASSPCSSPLAGWTSPPPTPAACCSTARRCRRRRRWRRCLKRGAWAASTVAGCSPAGSASRGGC
uniref:Uncharacterized protein n=1 Tax=Oryza brachyantha TaxID=4533 RepID=J3LQR8_ORYBR